MDAQQYQLQSVTRAQPQEQLDRLLASAVKSSFKQRAFRPAALPKPGDCAPVTAAVKRGRLGPPITVRCCFLVWSSPAAVRLLL